MAGYQSAQMLVDESTGEANFMFGKDWGVQAVENGHTLPNGKMHN